jgi:hypothetical protein
MKQLSVSKYRKRRLSPGHLDPEGIVIMKHGKPVGCLIPTASTCADLIGSMMGRVKVSGDVFGTGSWKSKQAPVTKS